jgi:hypothetical protein
MNPLHSSSPKPNSLLIVVFPLAPGKEHFLRE